MAARNIGEFNEDEQAKLVIRYFARKAQGAREAQGAFFEFVLREEHTNASLKMAPHQVLMFEFVDQFPHCVLMLPVGTSKTFGVASMGMRNLGVDPGMRGAIVSATQGQAAKPLRMIKDYIEQSGELRMTFPELRPSPVKSDPWRDDAITVRRRFGIRDPSLVAVGIGGAIQGSRINWALADDMLNAENTNTEAGRQTTNSWFKTSVFNRLDPRGSRCVVSNTPWHPKDLVHSLRDEGWPTLRMDVTGDVEFYNVGEWEPEDKDSLRPAHPGSMLCRLAANDPDPTNSRPLWTERYDEEAIAKLRRSYTPTDFNRFYRCLARADETSQVKEEWIELCKRRAREMNHLSFVHKYDGPNMTFTGLDLAVSPGEEHDKCCFFTFEALPSGHRKILEIDIGQWDGPTIVKKILSCAQRYNSIVTVENNGAQDFIRQFALAANASVPVKAYTTGRTKAHPEYGLPSLFVEISNGAWLIPNDRQRRVHPHVASFIEGLLYYAPNRHTDDSLMAAFFAREQAKKWGVLHGSGTEVLGEQGGGVPFNSR